MRWWQERKEIILLSLPPAVAILIFFVTPLINVFWISFTEPSIGLDNYALLFTSDGIQNVFLRTAKLSVITTVFAVVGGYVVAYVLAGSSPSQRRLMLFFILVPFWVSALARALAWLLLLGRNGPVNEALLSSGVVEEPLSFLYSELGVTVGMVHYMLPYAILPLFAAMKDLDPKLISASRGLGASPFQAFLHVYLPITTPGIIAASGLVFVYSLGFYVIPVILGGGRVLMIGQYISMNVLDTVQWGVASMLSVTLLVSILILVVTGSQVKRLAGRGGAGV